MSAMRSLRSSSKGVAALEGRWHMAVKQAAKAAPAKKPDDRIHGTVLHKPDRRVNEIVRKHSKSDIINLFNIDCCMLFRVDQIGRASCRERV